MLSDKNNDYYYFIVIDNNTICGRGRIELWGGDMKDPPLSIPYPLYYKDNAMQENGIPSFFTI